MNGSKKKQKEENPKFYTRLSHCLRNVGDWDIQILSKINRCNQILWSDIN